MVDIDNQNNRNNVVRNGSFRVNIPIARQYETDSLSGLNSIYPKYYEEVDQASYTVQMLTQNDYADGWQQIVPKAKHYTKKFLNTDGDLVSRLYSNAYRMKVNLAQLPMYLWHRMQYVDETLHTVNNGYHYYYVERTNVDDEIRELAELLTLQHNASYRDRVHELLNVLKDNDVYGWVIIKAKSMYH